MDDEILPDLGFSYLEAGRGDSTFQFGRVSCSMMARIEDEMFTTMTTITMDVAYAASFDFDAAGFARLLEVVSPAARGELSRIFAGPFRGPTQVDLPRGAVVVGLSARLGDPQTNGDETYVPFVVVEFKSPAELGSITVE